MDFPYKYIFLIVGMFLTAGGGYPLLMMLMGKEVSVDSKHAPEHVIFLSLIAFILGVMLLRQSWVMFQGLSRSVVF